MVIIISGPPAAGKSSVAKALAKKFSKSAYISTDQIRDMIIGGNIAPWEDVDGETISTNREKFSRYYEKLSK